MRPISKCPHAAKSIPPRFDLNSSSQAQFNEFLTNPSGFYCGIALNLGSARQCDCNPRELSWRSELIMSSTLFFAFCILGCDLLLYFLFQWTYGEKHRGIKRRHARRVALITQSGNRPFLVTSSKSYERSTPNPRSYRRMRPGKGVDGQFLSDDETLAYRRIASSFATTKK